MKTLPHSNFLEIETTRHDYVDMAHNDAKFFKERSTPPNLKFYEVWNKSNGEYDKKNYFNKKFKSLFMEIIPWIPTMTTYCT